MTPTRICLLVAILRDLNAQSCRSWPEQVRTARYVREQLTAALQVSKYRVIQHVRVRCVYWSLAGLQNPLNLPPSCELTVRPTSSSASAASTR